MNKEELKKSLFEQFKGKEVTEELIEEIKKAVKAGYETTPESPGKPVEDVEANAPTMDSNKVEAKEETKEATTEENSEVEASDENSQESEEKKEEETKEAEGTELLDTSEKTQGGKTEDIQFADELFQEFSLGATLKQRPHGNVMSNMKEPSMDYEQAYKNSIKNTKLSDEDFKKEDKE